MNCEVEHAAEEISEQSGEGDAWYYLNPHRKRQKGRHELKKESLSKMEPELGSLRKCSVCITAKKKKKMRKKGMAEQPLNNAGVSTDLISRLSGGRENDGVIPAKTRPV